MLHFLIALESVLAIIKMHVTQRHSALTKLGNRKLQFSDRWLQICESKIVKVSRTFTLDSDIACIEKWSEIHSYNASVCIRNCISKCTQTQLCSAQYSQVFSILG